MDHKARRKQIIEAAMLVAETQGYHKVTRGRVSEAANCSMALIQYHFNTIAALRTTVAIEANRQKNYAILVQLLADNLVDVDLLEPTFNFIRKSGA